MPKRTLMPRLSDKAIITIAFTVLTLLGIGCSNKPHDPLQAWKAALESADESWKRGDSSKAIFELESAVTMVENLPSRDSCLSETFDRLGSYYQSCDEWAKAEASYRNALSSARRYFEIDSSGNINRLFGIEQRAVAYEGSIFSLAHCLSSSMREASSVSDLEEIADYIATRDPLKAADLRREISDRGAKITRADRRSEIDSLYEEAVRVLELVCGPDDPRFAYALDFWNWPLLIYWVGLGDLKKAAKIEKRIVSIYERSMETAKARLDSCETHDDSLRIWWAVDFRLRAQLPGALRELGEYYRGWLDNDDQLTTRERSELAKEADLLGHRAYELEVWMTGIDQSL